MKGLLFGLLGMVAAFVASATPYTWNGGGNDGRWTNPSNWGGGGYPQSASDAAIFTSDVTVTLDSGTSLTVGYVSVATGKTVTLNGTEGSTLDPVKAAVGDGNGFVIAANGKLVLNVPVVSSGRIDKWGDGELVVNADITVSGNVYLLIDRGTMTLQGASHLSISDGILGLGNSQNRQPAKLVVTDSAHVVARGIETAIAANAQTAAGHVVQDGVDTEVTASEYVLLKGVAGWPEGMAIYELKNGTFTSGGNITLGKAGSGTGGDWAGGRFVQSGGRAVVGQNFAIARTTDGSAIDLSGGTLAFRTTSNLTIGAPMNLSGTPTIEVLSNIQIFLPAATTFAPGTALTKTGASSSILYANENYAVDGSLTVSGGYFLVGNSYSPKDVELSAPLNDHSPWPVTARGTGVFQISQIRARVTRPLALSLESGGKVRFPFVNDASNPILVRSALVAHSFTTNGVALAKGCYTKTNLSSAFSSDSAGSALIVVPYVWTGAGDGTNWNDAANWDGNAVPPSANTTAVDLSRAGGKTIVLDEPKIVTCIIFNPQGHDRKLTLSGSGKIIHDCPSFIVGMVVGPGRELVFDVDVDKPSYTSFNTPAIVGGGRVTVKRNFPGILSADSYKRAGYVVDGELAFAGTTAFLTSDANKLFGVGTWEPQGRSKIVFEDGCNLTAYRLDPSPIGNVVASDEWVQNGGNVSLRNFYFTRYYSLTRTPFSYTLNGGNLTLSDEFCVGSYYYNNSTYPPLSGGEFVMNGGTFTVKEIRCQRNGNYIHLNGGDVYLKAGFKDTFTSQEQAVTNELSLKIGGATIHATGTWACALTAELTGKNGAGTFDTAGCNVTFSKAVSGVGGLVKDGAGILTFSAAATFTGPVVVNRGSVVFASTVDGPSDFTVNSGTYGGSVSFQTMPAATLDSIVASSANDIVVSAAASGLSVKRLVIGGVLQPVGSVAVNGGTVTVTGSEKSVWQGPNGGNWSTTANWTGAVPNDTAAEVDFGFSALAAEATINVDANVTLSNLVYRHATDGASLSLTGSGPITFAADGVITVPAGHTLVVDANVTLLGGVTKKGLGTLVLNGAVTSPGDGDTYWLIADEGNVVVNGAVSKCRLRVESGLVTPVMTIGEGAVVSNSVSVNPGWTLGYGAVLQNGGVVDMNPPTPGFVGEKRWAVTYRNGKYTLNGGTLTFYKNWTRLTYTDNGMFEFVQNGGTLKVGQVGSTASSCLSRYDYTLNGGTNEIEVGWANGTKKGLATAYLNGGTIVSGGNAAMFAPTIDVVLGGDVTFAQKSAAVAVTLGSEMTGEGTIRQAGPGTLTLAGDNWFTGAVAVDGGTLAFASPLQSGTTLDIDSGATVSIDCDEVVVQRLAVNGNSRRAGVYSAAGNNLGGRVTGSGVLVVLEGNEPGTMIIFR